MSSSVASLGRIRHGQRRRRFDRRGDVLGRATRRYERRAADPATQHALRHRWAFTARIGANLTGVEVAKSDPNRLYLTMATDVPVRPPLVRSIDGGRTFDIVDLTDSLGSRKPYLGAVDPEDPSRLFLRLIGGPADGLALSEDGGATFQVVLEGDAPFSALLIRSDGTVLVANINGGGFLSSDRGRTFSP